MQKSVALLCCALLTYATVATAQESVPERGAAERIGERIDRGLDRLGDEIREGWNQMRRSINEFGVQGRVYSRLRWDKAIDVDTLDIAVRERDEVVLRGSVADEATRRKAVQLAEETVGVSRVTDELQVLETTGTTQPVPTR